MKKRYIINIFLFEYEFILIEWKYVLISYKYVLLNMNLFWLNKNITLKRDSFAVSSGWNETYKVPAHSLERTVCLFRQQRIKKIKGNKGGEDLYLTKRFIWKQRETFLSNNCYASVKQLWALTFIMAQATLRAEAWLSKKA